MARGAGISQASAQRLWAANAIKPHLSRTFKLSNEPAAAQAEDIIATGKADPLLATTLAYMLLPQIFFYGLGALLGAVLNSRGAFGASSGTDAGRIAGVQSVGDPV